MILIRASPYVAMTLDIYEEDENRPTVRTQYAYAYMYRFPIRAVNRQVLIALFPIRPYAVINLYVDIEDFLNLCRTFVMNDDNVLVGPNGVGCGYAMPMLVYRYGQLFVLPAGQLSPDRTIRLVDLAGRCGARVNFVSSSLHARSCIRNFDVSGDRSGTIYLSSYSPSAQITGKHMVKISPIYETVASSTYALMYTTDGLYTFECRPVALSL